MPLRAMTGHRRLLELLARAIVRGTLPPSLVFAGPEGVGKRTAALALAQALNCERPVPFPDESGISGCGDCGACTRIARGVHADVLVIEPGDSGTIKVDQVREAIDRAAYRPFEGRRRVVIVDDADALMAEAQNALLKTLEEPPSASIFVLITPRPDMLLPTVRSRCHRLRFGPLSPADVAAALIARHGMTAADAHAAAAASGGSLGRALGRNAEAIADARGVAARVLQAAASTADPRRRLEAARALVGAGDRDELTERLLALSSLLRDIGLAEAGADPGALANADLGRDIDRLAGAFGGERAVAAFGSVDRALDALDRNASSKIVADWLALQL